MSDESAVNSNENDADWKRRYDALRRFRDEEHERTLNELNALKTGGGGGNTAPSGLTPEERADLGETEQRAFDRFEQRLASQENTLRQQQEAAFNAFLAEMDAVVPNWRALNSHAAFINWLSQHDPSIGRTRKQLFDAYVADRDVKGAASFFTDYTKQIDSAAPAPVPSEPGTVAPDANAGNMTEMWSPEEVAAHDQQLNALMRDRSFRVGHPLYQELMERDQKISRARAEGRIG